jgi:hypothetical protein
VRATFSPVKVNFTASSVPCVMKSLQKRRKLVSDW